jgi:signal peptidase I
MEEKQKQVTAKLTKEVLSWCIAVVIAIVFAFLVIKCVIVNAQVPTPSMETTIMVGDRLIGYRLAYLFDSPQRGDIVIFRYPDNEAEMYVKRIIGMPGEHIKIQNGQIFINDHILSEDYIMESMNTEETIDLMIPEHSYFVLGDNRNHSKDSRYWTHKFVEKRKIIAKVVLRYYSGEKNQIEFSNIR